MPPIGADRRIRFPASWTEEQKDEYVRFLAETSRRLRQKERESGIPFRGETVVLRR